MSITSPLKPSISIRSLNTNGFLQMMKSGLGKYQHKIVGPDFTKVYSAGPSIQDIHSETSVKEVISKLVGES